MKRYINNNRVLYHASLLFTFIAGIVGMVEIPQQGIHYLIVCVAGIIAFTVLHKYLERPQIQTLMRVRKRHNKEDLSNLGRIIYRNTGSLDVAFTLEDFVSRCYPKQDDAKWESAKNDDIEEGRYSILISMDHQAILSTGYFTDHGRWLTSVDTDCDLCEIVAYDKASRVSHKKTA